MWGTVFTVVSLCSLLFYLYGVLITITVTEKNDCKMTYMFEYPQFVKINFDKNNLVPKYNLFAYSEGRQTENVRNMKFTGAPVIYVPGNAGSYKQARSLASVALRKGIDNNWVQHLDYFTIDYNEEFSGLFGGFLEEQATYLGLCIIKVLSLYQHLPNRPQTVVLVGHSMGGKIVQAAMMEPNISAVVNTVIMLSVPLDRPVLNMDLAIDKYYRKIHQYWSMNRSPAAAVTNETNSCCAHRRPLTEMAATATANYKRKERPAAAVKLLEDVLLLSIGGGSRDVLVHSDLSASVFSDMHAMSTAVPNLWLTTDHLCSVWCLQQVLLINKFLYSIIAPSKHRDQGFQFIEDKATRLLKAKQQFTPDRTYRQYESVNIAVNTEDLGDWVEDSRRVFSHQFKDGLTKTRYQMIRLINQPQHQMLNIETVNIDGEDWLFGCAANKVNNYMRYCTDATAIDLHVQKLPSRSHERKLVSIDLHQFQEKWPAWTHIIIRILPTKKPIQLNVDVHSPADREIEVRMPKWYQYTSQTLLGDTILGSSIYTLKIVGMDEAYQTMELLLEPTRNCSRYHNTAKVCVPYVYGFDRYHHFTESESKPLAIYASTSKPLKYNSTINPIVVELYLDPSCRYTLTARNAFGQSLARIVQLFSQWLPAHMVAVMLLTLKHQMSLTPKDEPFKCGTLAAGLLGSSSFFIITASRVFTKIVLWATVLPPPDAFEHSLIVSVIIHGCALAMLTLVSGAVWATTCFAGNILYKVLFRLIHLPFAPSGVLLAVIQKCPISCGVVLVSMAFSSCGGLALLCAVYIYFILLSKMYENYLEDYVYSTVKKMVENVLGNRNGEDNSDESAAATAEISTEVKAKSPKKAKNLSNEEHVNEETTLIRTEDEDDEEDDEDENSEETTAASEAELDKLLKESMEQQVKLNADKSKEEQLKRAEYDAIPDGYESINFHMSLFMCLLILTALNLPTMLAWARNYPFSRSLDSDPSFLPAIITLPSLTVLWQLSTPRNINGYRVLTSIFYMLAVICVLYCQESIFRLNAVLPTMFFVVAVHQLVMPTFKKPVLVETPEEIALRERIRRFKEMNAEDD